MKYSQILSLLFFLFLSLNINAQDSVIPEKVINPFSIGVRGHYGFVIQHSQWVKSVKNSYPRGFEVDFNWHLNRELEWNRCRCYPSFGAFAFFMDYGRPEVLAYGFGGGIYFEHYFGFPSTFNVFIRGGVGPSYLTNPFDKETNPNNMSYAMHLNFHLFLNLGIQWQINERWYSNFSVNMNHDSNAGIKEPNGGVNYPTVSLGAGYTFNPGKFIDRGESPCACDAKRWDVAVYWGLSAVEYPDRGQFPMYGVNVMRSLQITRSGAALFGAEFEMNGRGRWKNQTYHHNKFDYHRASILGGWEFLMGRAKFSVALGFYVYRPIVESDFVYQRYGLVYHVSNHIFTGINFKAYRHTADFVDFRVGYSF